MRIKFSTGECNPSQAGQSNCRSLGQVKNKTKYNFKYDCVVGPKYVSGMLDSAGLGLDSPVQFLTLKYHIISIKMLIDIKKYINMAVMSISLNLLKKTV